MSVLRVLLYLAVLTLGLSIWLLLGLNRESEAAIRNLLHASLVLVALVVLLLLVNAGLEARHRQRLAARSTDEALREASALARLLDEVGALRQGDLRVRASETDERSAALAATFNQAIAELRWLVGAIDASSVRINGSVQISRASTQHLVESCTRQAEEAHRASNYVGTMSETMSELSDHATESARIATVSVAEAEAGVKAIADCVQRLSRIRDGAVLTTRLMARLAENATAIDERVDTIRDVAQRTDLLALNTTIRAAASGSGDLSRLSDEVTQLADLLGGATRDITSLSRTIRQDADDTVAAMDKTHRALGSGLAQVEQASEALESIESVSRDLRGLGRDIARKTVRQGSVVRQVTEKLASINRVATENLREAQQRAGTLEHAHAVVQEMAASVASYRLPATSSVSIEQTRPAATRALRRAASGSGAGRAVDVRVADGPVVYERAADERAAKERAVRERAVRERAVRERTIDRV